MANILIVNIDSVSGLGVSRQLWMLNENDIVISPMPVDPHHLDYVGHTLGFDTSTVSVLAGNQRLIDEYDDHIAARFSNLSRQLENLLDRSASWDLVPCQYTVGVAELAEQMGFPLSEGLRFAAQRGPDLFNRKSHFRRLATGAGLPIPDGSIAVSPAGLARALERYLSKTSTVIVKHDNSRAGRGNITITRADAGPLPGSRETWQVDDDLQTTATALWHKLTDDRSRTLVVEAYHEATHCFWHEFFIDDSGQLEPLNSGTFRRQPDADPTKPALVWVGLDLPAELPSASAAEAMSLTTQLVSLCAQVGYRGFINVDAILTPEDGILINEVNGRWGGGLVLDVIARRLLGKRYADQHVVSSFSDIAPIPFSDILNTLKTNGLHYSSSSQEGIVIVGGDSKNTEYAVIAASRRRSREIEATFRKVVGEVLAYAPGIPSISHRAAEGKLVTE